MAPSESKGFFGVIAEPQSYRNILYLFLGLPLGILYFTVLVIGVSVGVSLIVVALVGLLILMGLWYVVRGFMGLERSLAMGLLGVRIAPIPPLPEAEGLWTRFKAFTADRPTWRGFWYLLLRFVVGTFTFTVAVTLIATPVGLAFSPAWMWTSNDLEWGSWTFDPLPWSFLAAPIGFLLIFVSLHIINALARACGRWAQSSLGRGAERSG
jgi:hypothetical protein